jgi:hypothetical protein
MKLKTKCKYCERVIELDVDDSYADLGDPNKLYRLASCTRCGDFMSERNRLFRLVGKQARLLVQGRRDLTGEDLEKVREVLRHDLKDIMRLHAAHLSMPVPDWEEAILDSIMDNPGEFGNVLNKLAQMAREPMLI